MGVTDDFDKLKNEVHQMARSSKESDEEKMMWKSVESELQKIKVESLEENHPLFLRILDDSLTPFTNMTEESRNIFSKSSKNFLIPTNEKLKSICNEFIQSEKTKREEIPKFGDATLGMFLDGEEKLQELTNKMLVELGRVWGSPKWNSYANQKLDINEGSYVCEVLAPLFNIAMNDLPLNTNKYKIWGTW